MFAINRNGAAELRELAFGQTEKLMNSKSDTGARRVDPIGIGPRRRQTENRNRENEKKGWPFHFVPSSTTSGRARVRANCLSKGARDIGNFPNKLPKAKAG